MDVFIKYSIAAIAEAIVDSSIVIDADHAYRDGVAMGQVLDN